MTRRVAISNVPCWDGANIVWTSSVDHSHGDAVRLGSWRQYPLQDLLRTIGREMDELRGQDVTIAETPNGFAVCLRVQGQTVRYEYTRADLEARAAQSRDLRRRRQTSAGS